MNATLATDAASFTAISIEDKSADEVVSADFARALERRAIAAEQRLVETLEAQDVLLAADKLAAAESDCERRIAEAVAHQWQPIDTAPKGRKIMVAYKNQLGNWRTVLARYFQPPVGDDDFGDDDSGLAPLDWYEEVESHETILPVDEPPTHWMPLPSPPVAIRAEPKGE